MIQANELRIGNFYKTKYNEYQVRDFDFCNGNSKNFDPIPLTEEWLLKFGIKDGEHFIKLKSGTLGEIKKNPNGWKVYLNGRFGLVYLDSVKYVHQLQNLYFALTQIELELKQI